MSVVHELKTLPVYFDAVERGEKTFEVRKDDRGFQKGDTVRLLRLHPNGIVGRQSVDRRILWILTGGQFGVEPGYVVLALGPTTSAGKETHS